LKGQCTRKGGGGEKGFGKRRIMMDIFLLFEVLFERKIKARRRGGEGKEEGLDTLIFFPPSA